MTEKSQQKECTGFDQERICTSDRREESATGIFGILNIRENTVISSLKKHKKGFYLSEKSMKEDTQKYIDALRTKTPSQETKIRALSGGNQQKVILGRWLLTDPEVLLLDEPTRGIDVGAKYEIYQLIIDLANRGKVVIVVSSRKCRSFSESVTHSWLCPVEDLPERLTQKRRHRN